ncbi:MAG: DUF1800 domain-containing protein [Verrucomicrobia bacterium]|nr:DUF1800 domain-containing protein [Verrucomicrobiota bacterium]
MLNPLPVSEWTPQAAAHLLNRAAFGGTPDEIQKLHALGHRGAVESLLGAGEELDLFPAPEMEPLAARMHALKKENLSREAFQERKKKDRALTKQQTEELRQWWLRRMLKSPNPAREKATLFWHGHWATGIRKVNDPFLMHRQNETLRANALGPFAPLAKQITRDPAMMRYLDLQSSSAKKPNENFAREVMELFTLGEGYYSEADITEAARAFTGYRMNQRTGSFEFSAKQADSRTKTVLGKTGPLTGDDVIDIIVAQPRCSEFLAAKIWTFYAGTKPPEPLQKALGKEYRLRGMDTGKLLRSIFTSREFYEPVVVRHQIKSPVQWLIQMCKALEIPLLSQKQSLSLLSNLGQNLFEPPSVKGWDGGRAWISSSTLLVRYNAAGNIVRGGTGPKPNIDQIFPSALSPEQAVDLLAWRLFQSPMPPALRDRTLAFLSENGSSPAARCDLLHLLMSTPEYQLT